MLALIGFPTDSNSSYLRGAAQAPAAIRAEFLGEAGNPYAESGVSLRAPGLFTDVGDAPMREDATDRETIERAIEEQLELGRRVVSLGGDHSITYPIMRAYTKRFPGLTIVHFDAHPDMYPSFQGNPYSHASPFARILEDTAVCGLVQIGIRTMTPPQKEVADAYGVRVFNAWELDQARSVLPSGPVYISLDLDALDPAFAPGVSHREPGGLSVRDVLELVKQIPGDVVGADVVEYNPMQDVGSVTAAVAAKFVKEFIARMSIG